jgi:SAM-dependent methyltransferase
VTVILRRRDGPAIRLALDAWTAPATVDERMLLDGLVGPVLDLGCGPGRLVVALAERGTMALGIDASPTAASRTYEQGGAVLCRSVFEPLPGEGRWRTVLLFDGNIGIGGDPTALLHRIRDLLRPDGTALVEVDRPGSVTLRSEARVETQTHVGPWFPWAWVGADELAALARAADLAITGWSRPTGRWIARLAPAASW